MTSLLIFGSGGHSDSIFEIAEITGWKVTALIDPYSSRKEKFGVPLLAHVDNLEIESSTNLNAFIAVGENWKRKEIYKSLASNDKSFNFPNLIHPDASVASNVILGQGNVIMRNASIGAGAVISDFVIIGANSNVDHGCYIGSFSQISPGSTLAGQVNISENVFVGAGATVTQKLTIGSNTVLGAGSLLLNNLEPNTLAFGLPAKKIRDRNETENVFS